jgi:hypothetical protein
MTLIYNPDSDSYEGREPRAFAIQSVDIVAPFDTDLLQQFAKQAFATVQQNTPAQ